MMLIKKIIKIRSILNIVEQSSILMLLSIVVIRS